MEQSHRWVDSQEGIEPKTELRCPQCREEYQGKGRDEVLQGKAIKYCGSCKFPLLLVAGKYQLLRQLSDTATAVLYSARHQQLQRAPKRVVKFLKPSRFQNASAKKRFWREVQLTASISQRNQHIVRIFDDFGEIPQLGSYYIMEHLNGKTLEEMLGQGSLPIPLAVLIVLQICDALNSTHEEGIVHKNLRPSNIHLIEQGNNAHFVKVTDFGSALTTTDTMEQIGEEDEQDMPLYMAPEQFSEHTVDHRADIYTLGTILYEMLSGQPPFPMTRSMRDSGREQSLSLHAIATAHLMETPPPLSAVCPERNIPHKLEEIVERCLQKDPEKRYQSVEEILRALETLTILKSPEVAATLQFPPHKNPFVEEGFRVSDVWQEHSTYVELVKITSQPKSPSDTEENDSQERRTFVMRTLSKGTPLPRQNLPLEAFTEVDMPQPQEALISYAQMVEIPQEAIKTAQTSHPPQYVGVIATRSQRYTTARPILLERRELLEEKGRSNTQNWINAPAVISLTPLPNAPSSSTWTNLDAAPWPPTPIPLGLVGSSSSFPYVQLWYLLLGFLLGAVFFWTIS